LIEVLFTKAVEVKAYKRARRTSIIPLNPYIILNIIMWLAIIVISILCFAKGEETLKGQVRQRIREHTNVDIDYNVRAIDDESDGGCMNLTLSKL
jgi:hypothetical protein